MSRNGLAVASLVQSERWVRLAGSEACALLALVERDVEQRLPEAPRADEVISEELDQIQIKWHVV